MVKIFSAKFKNYRYLFGIILSIIGVTFSVYLNWLFPFVKWSPLIMSLSAILMMNKNFFKIHFKYNKVLMLIILYQLLMLLYGFLNVKGAMSSQYLSFHIYIIVLCLLYSSLDKNVFLERLPSFMFYSSLWSSVLGAFYCYKGYVVGEQAWLMRQDMDYFALEPFTIASGALTNLFAALLMEKEGKMSKIFMALGVFLDVYILFSCEKRTPIFVTILGCIILFYRKGSLSQKALFKILKVIPVIFFIMLLAYFNFDSFHEKVDGFVTNFFYGVLNLLGDTSVSDSTGSAMERVSSRTDAINYIFSNFTFLNFIFGAGYMFKWLDAPLFEAYFDMGILGFLCYLYLIVWYPLRNIFWKNINKVQLLALLFAIYPMASCMNSGTPYMWNKYVAVCLLAYSLKNSNVKIKRR